MAASGRYLRLVDAELLALRAHLHVHDDLRAFLQAKAVNGQHASVRVLECLQFWGIHQPQLLAFKHLLKFVISIEAWRLLWILCAAMRMLYAMRASLA